MNEQKQHRFSLAENVINASLQYLATKPYNEVAQLISAIQQDIKAVEEKLEPEAKD